MGQSAQAQSMRNYHEQAAAHNWTDYQLSPWIAAISTILAGILPMVAITYYAKTLWRGVPIDSPLLAVPSVWIGDSIFLPILNYRIVKFLRFLPPDNDPPSSRKTFWIVSGTFMLSVLIAGYSHYMWTHDQFLGFIDTTYGTLSFAGWWHLGFTIIQMTVVFSFISLWRKVAGIKATTAAYEYGHEVWAAFLYYALVSIADFVVLHLNTLPRRPVKDYTWATAWEGLLVIPFWFIVKKYLQTLKQRHQ